MNRRTLVLLLALAALPLAGCATTQAIDEHVDFDLTDKTAFYRDQWVRRGPPEVHVKPVGTAASAPKVLFVPFRVTQPMSNPGIAGYSIARVVWQTWLTMRLFPAMEFTGDDTPYRRDVAVAIAKQRGADLVVGGFVTYLYAGGTAGDSQVALQIEAHDVHSGQMVWSISQSGHMPAAQTRDYFLFATKTRMPSDPVQAITKAIAIDAGKVVQDWFEPAPAEKGLQKIDRQTRDILYPQRDPVPAPRTAGGQQPQREDKAF